MDRSDEKKDPGEVDEVAPREGDVLGLGGSTVPKQPGDPSVANDPESVRRRRDRALVPEDDPHVGTAIKSN